MSTCARRSVTSSVPAARGSAPSRPDCRRTAGTAGSRACAARRSRCSPGSRSTTTCAWSAAAWAEPPRASWTPWPTRCTSRTPSATTSSPWRGRPARAPPAGAVLPSTSVRPAIQQILDAVTDAPAWIRNGRHDILAMNDLARASTPRCWRTRVARRTPPGSSTSPGGRAGAVRRLRPGRPRRSGHAAPRGRTQPARQGPDRAGRRAVHPERALPAAMGLAGRPLPPQRPQASASPCCRPARPRLRGPGAPVRARPRAEHLHRGRRHPDRRRPQAPRVLGREPGVGARARGLPAARRRVPDQSSADIAAE